MTVHLSQAPHLRVEPRRSHDHSVLATGVGRLGGFLSAYARLDRAIDADLLAHDGIRHVEFEVLLRLWRQPDRRLRIQELAAQSLLTRSGVSRLCDRLVRMGHLTREAAPRIGVARTWC